MIKNTEKLNVLNYNENRVSTMVSPTENYSFEPSPDGITPTVIPMTIDQIRYANNHNAFRGGFLFFEPNREKEIYEAIGINDWENILKNEDIKDILLNPTFEGLQRIISIKDSAVFERVRAVYHKLKMEGTHDISVRVAQIINTRYKELQNRKVNTSIVLEKRDVPVKINSEEVDALKAENKAMQEQMAKMQEMMDKLLKQSNNTGSTTSASKRTQSKSRKSVE